MNTNNLFDTHAYIDTLERAGVLREHAVAISKANQEMLSDTLRSGLATKDDVVNLQQSIKDDVVNLQQSIKNDVVNLQQSIKNVENRLDRRIDGLEAKIEKLPLQLTITLGSMIVIAIGVVSAVIKLL